MRWRPYRSVRWRPHLSQLEYDSHGIMFPIVEATTETGMITYSLKVNQMGFGVGPCSYLSK